MISAMGKRLAAAFGLSVDPQNGVLFGAAEGYQVAVVENTSQQKYCILFPARPFKGEPFQTPEDFLQGLAQGRKEIQMVLAEATALRVTVKMRSYKKTAETFREVFAAVAGYLRINGFASCCMGCGMEGTNGLYALLGQCQFLCGDCALRAEDRLQEMEAQQAQVKSSLAMGLLGAFLGSLIGVAAWVLVYQLGYIAVAVGLLLLFCAMKGYEKLGGCMDRKGVVATVILSVVMALAALYLCYGVEVYKVYGDRYGLLECFLAVPAALGANPEIMGSFVKDLLLSCFFMGLASLAPIISVVRGGSRSSARVIRIG